MLQKRATSQLLSMALTGRYLSSAASIQSRFEEAYQRNKAIFDQKQYG